MKLPEKAKKSLGQNFIKDKNIIKKIVKIANINNNSSIIEIGPGYGDLTDAIIHMKPKKIIAIEKDIKLFTFLNKKYLNKTNVNVINDDIFNFIKKNNIKKNLIVFGNLPYNISTQILASLIMLKKWPPWYNNLILMFQKEVADRILAKVGSKNYGRLSILANWRLDVKKQFDIKKNSFFPIPNVNSTLLSFKTKKNEIFPLKNPSTLEMITRVFFSNRRKMINKSFKKIFGNNMLIAQNLNLNLNIRPEEINNETYYKISMFYEKLNK
jgi:16S rRNA (adenine1518-N6/adenine1519-N6)-dimethyltransferase